MRTDIDLKKKLSSINGKSYGLYKTLTDKYDFNNYILCIDHVQSDPFAGPSKVRIIMNQKLSKFPSEIFDTHYKKIALQDYLARLFYTNINKFTSKGFGSGKSGIISISKCDQEILERTCVIVSDKQIEVRFNISFPAKGRTILAYELEKILFESLPKIITNSLIYNNIETTKLQKQINLSEDQYFIRRYLNENGLVAFISNGSILPRESGISTKPLNDSIKFKSPKSYEIELTLPNKGVIKGMAIAKGITLIVGGGYHGKSTLLKALELGVYNHIEGDGREFVITDESALKVRAEDGRYINKTDISLFINNLPNNKDTKKFISENASGSTSQAANVIEGIESNSKVLLIDEDTSATNFMIRDNIMQKLVSIEKEPITPFIDVVSSLYDQLDISTIIVVGSCGDYFDIANNVIQMDCYNALDVTEKAKSLSSGYTLKRISNNNIKISPNFNRILLKGSIKKGPKGVKIKTLGTDGLMINRDTVDLKYLEQLVDSEQVTALGYMMKYIEDNLVNSSDSLQTLTDNILKFILDNGLISISQTSHGNGSMALPRKQEIIGCFNRYRNLKIK